MPAIIIQKEGPFHDYETKLRGFKGSDSLDDLSLEEHWMVKNAAGQIHKKLGLKHYSRVDFIIHPKRGLYLLEINSLPALHRESVFHKGLRSAGTSFKDFLGHILDLARLEK